jgi:hypothetical protein
MGRERLRGFLTDSLMTVGAIYVAIAGAGAVGVLLFAAGLAPVGSLLTYAVLLALYVFATAPGRRTAGPVYLLVGCIYPVVALAVFIFTLGASPMLRMAAGLVCAGIGIGFQFSGGADTPLEAYLPLIYANILGPILLVLLARTVWILARRD